MISRRGFLGAVAAAALLPGGLKRALAAEIPTPPSSGDIPIVDAHAHFFDPTRPQGIPWPAKTNAITYKTSLPQQYREVAAPLGVRGVIAIECSTWLEDNQWVLDVAAGDAIIVGTVGDLEPGKPGFRANLDRFRENPLFRGIRYGNLWGRDMPADLPKPDFISDMKALADAGLELDTAKVNPSLLEAIVRLTDKVPNLRIVIDHLGQADPPEEPAARAAYRANMRELGHRPQVYAKVSEVLRHADGRVPEDPDFYRPKLDELWETFGEDRLLYGSDWPNCNQWAPYPVVLKVVRDFFSEKGRTASEKFFWKNSLAAYRWVKRASAQPEL